MKRWRCNAMMAGIVGVAFGVLSYLADTYLPGFSDGKVSALRNLEGSVIVACVYFILTAVVLSLVRLLRVVFSNNER